MLHIKEMPKESCIGLLQRLLKVCMVSIEVGENIAANVVNRLIHSSYNPPLKRGGAFFQFVYSAECCAANLTLCGPASPVLSDVLECLPGIQWFGRVTCPDVERGTSSLFIDENWFRRRGNAEDADFLTRYVAEVDTHVSCHESLADCTRENLAQRQFEAVPVSLSSEGLIIGGEADYLPIVGDPDHQ